MKDKINSFFSLKKEILTYFNYHPHPSCNSPQLKDMTDYFWMVEGNKFLYAEVPFQIETNMDVSLGRLTSIEIPNVLPGENFTLLCSGTTGEEEMLLIFDNEKECKDATIKTEMFDILRDA